MVRTLKIEIVENNLSYGKTADEENMLPNMLDNDLQSMLERFWTIENVNKNSKENKNDQWDIRYQFKKKQLKFNGQIYIVALPFKAHAKDIAQQFLLIKKPD